MLEATRLEARLASGDTGGVELHEIKSTFAAIEKENSELREQVYTLRQENRNADLQVREWDQVKVISVIDIITIYVHIVIRNYLLFY